MTPITLALKGYATRAPLHRRIERFLQILDQRRHHHLSLFRREAVSSGQANIGHTESELGLILIRAILHALFAQRDQ